MQVDQGTVVEWFDSTYRKKGRRYLRPVCAYHVFPALLNVDHNDRLLDVACGLGHLLRAAADCTAHLHGIDISNVAVSQARHEVPNASIVVANAEQLPYPDGTFDVVTCLGSLERMIDTGRVLDEIRRVARPGARFCFLVRNSNTVSWRHFGRFVSRQRLLGHADANDIMAWQSLFERHDFRVADVLPDQYPLHRSLRWKSVFLRRVDYRKPVRQSAALERANEFVFLLENAE